MEQFAKALHWTHIGAGFLALAIFWIPMVLKKGGLAHRRFGWVYVFAMGVVCVSSIALAPLRIWGPAGIRLESDEGKLASAALAYVALFSFSAAFFGVRVLRYKTNSRPPGRGADIAIYTLVLLTSLGVMAVGIIQQQLAAAVFPILGVVFSVRCLQVLLTHPSDRMFWWYQHMGSMIGACIATITAFLVVNAANFGTAYGIRGDSVVVWLAPAIIGVPLSALWQIIYQRRFTKAAPEVPVDPVV